MKKLLITGAAVLLIGCWDIPWPKPTPEPSPTPTATPDPPTTTTVPSPPPTAPPTAPPTEPPPPEVCSIRGVSPVPGLPSLDAEINQVLSEEFPCGVGSHCITGMTPMQGLLKVVKALRDAGFCAGLNRDSDAILISDSPLNMAEEYHCITFQEPSLVAWAVDPETRPGAKPCHGTPCKDEEKLGSYRGDWTIESGEPGTDPTPEPLECPSSLKPSKPVGNSSQKRPNGPQCYHVASYKDPGGGELPASCIGVTVDGGPQWIVQSGDLSFTEAGGNPGDLWKRWRTGTGVYKLCGRLMDDRLQCSIFRAESNCKVTFLGVE